MNLNQYLSRSGVVAKSLADDLNIPPPLISRWRNNHRQIPAERCPTIERLTGGLVTCEEMRPDVEWSYIRNKKQPSRKKP